MNFIKVLNSHRKKNINCFGKNSLILNWEKYNNRRNKKRMKKKKINKKKWT
jgi:hypothetical protein